MKRAPDPTTNLHTSSALLQLPSLMSLTPAQLMQELLGPLPTITSALVSPALAQTLTPLLSLARCLTVTRSQPFSFLQFLGLRAGPFHPAWRLTSPLHSLILEQTGISSLVTALQHWATHPSPRPSMVLSFSIFPLILAPGSPTLLGPLNLSCIDEPFAAADTPTGSAGCIPLAAGHASWLLAASPAPALLALVQPPSQPTPWSPLPSPPVPTPASPWKPPNTPAPQTHDLPHHFSRFLTMLFC